MSEDSSGDRGDNDGQTKDGGSSSGNSDGTDQSSNGGKTSTVEKVVMVVSVLFTLSLVAYGGWQMAMTPDTSPPNASVVDTESLPNDEVAVTVRLTNPRDVGLVSATVESECTTPPPSVEFTYVPASSTRQGTLVCPPNTTDPNVSAANWVAA